MTNELNEKLGTTDVTWNMEDLYDSPDDELLADDLDLCMQEAELVAENQGRLAELEVQAFARLVRRIERIHINLARRETFAFLYFATRVNDSKAGALLQKCREESSRVQRMLVFFDLEWAQMDKEKAGKFLTAEETATYHHYLSRLRRYAPHLLSVPEETLLVDLAPAGRQSWLTLFEKILAHTRFGKQGRTEQEVLADLYAPERTVRKEAALELASGLEGQLHVLTHIFNTVMAEKMIQDRIRRYPAWISSRNLDNEIDDSTVETLTDCTTGRYDIVQRYYAMKQQMLGLDELHDYDRYAPLPSLPAHTVKWQECRDMVLEGFRDFSPEMADIATLFFEHKWIHAPVLEGKRAGAFAHPAVPDAHPYIMVNYTGKLRDVSTVAHELGHGVHQYLARERGYFNSDTPLVMAETASVFAELLVFNRQLSTLDNGDQRRAFICQKLESIFATVFRQISMFRFEDSIHTARREKGELSTDAISDLWLQSQEEMFGNSLKLGDHYRCWWSYIPHFLRVPGYVYAYTFGELLVLSLYRIYQEQPDDFVPRYMELLSLGGSRSPEELLAPFGINLDDPIFWNGGLQVIEDMLEQVERETS